MIDKIRFTALCEKNGILLDSTAVDRFDLFASLLVEWNKKMNLTAITEPQEIEVKHFLDCLMVQNYFDLSQTKTAVDIGAGAGFPSIPLLICNEHIEFTLVDSLNKRLEFLDVVCGELGLNARLIHSRAEELGQDENFRECFDLAVARAVAPMNVLSEYCLPFVKQGGSFVALKGSNDDISPAQNAIETLGGELVDTVSYKLNGEDVRTLAIVKKLSQTPTQYPRKPKKISTKPL